MYISVCTEVSVVPSYIGSLQCLLDPEGWLEGSQAGEAQGTLVTSTAPLAERKG